MFQYLNCKINEKHINYYYSSLILLLVAVNLIFIASSIHNMVVADRQTDTSNVLRL